jgi:drug/metabolite transporter (DMT)-like permease
MHSKKLQHAKQGLLWGALSGAFWGLDGVLLGITITLAPFIISTNNESLLLIPMTSACLHDGFAALWLTLYNLKTGRIKEITRSLRIRAGKIVALAALFGGPLAMTGYLLAIQWAGAAYTMAITAIYPALGTFLAIFFLKEKMSLRALIGIALCIVGSFIVSYTPPQSDAFPHFYWGILCALVPTFGWALEGVISTYAMDVLDPAVAINIRQSTSFLVYSLIVIPIGLGLKGFSLILNTLSTHIMGSGILLLFTGLIGATSYLFWYRSMNMTGVGRAMALNITFALWSIVFGFFLTDLKITMTLVLGALVITSGALLVMANPKELVNLRNG